MYLCVSGTVRAISAVVDDPRGDPIISLAHWMATTLWARNRGERATIARERREGTDAPDVLRTGEWAELHGVDYVVLSARRKPEWEAGAIILTSSDWYKLGVPFDIQTPAGMWNPHPPTQTDTPAEDRRGRHYELPPMRTMGRK